MCSSTLLYLLFTESIHTVHPQISMIQLVAPSQTASEMLDGQRERETERERERERWKGLDVQRRGSVFSLKRRQQKNRRKYIQRREKSVARWKKESKF